MTPAQINKELMKISNIGTCTIFTIVNGLYVWYLPMFVYLLRRSYPEYQLHILADTEEPEILALPGVKGFKSIHGHQLDGGFRSAAMRFLYDDDTLTSSDYTLITDADMLIIREANSIVDQHMLSLRKNNLECYDNYLNNGDRCPGVHFVTKDWWKRTEDAREKESQKLYELEHTPYDHDEKMLLRIIRDSKLPEPPAKVNPWTYHGQHLGEWRKRTTFGNTNRGNAMAAFAITSDAAFMEIAEHCDKKAPALRIMDSLKLMAKTD